MGLTTAKELLEFSFLQWEIVIFQDRRLSKFANLGNFNLKPNCAAQIMVQNLRCHQLQSCKLPWHVAANSQHFYNSIICSVIVTYHKKSGKEQRFQNYCTFVLFYYFCYDTSILHILLTPIINVYWKKLLARRCHCGIFFFHFFFFFGVETINILLSEVILFESSKTTWVVKLFFPSFNTATYPRFELDISD